MKPAADHLCFATINLIGQLKICQLTLKDDISGVGTSRHLAKPLISGIGCVELKQLTLLISMSCTQHEVYHLMTASGMSFFFFMR